MKQVFEAALFDELQHIYPDTATSEGSKIYRVSAANGGYAGVHIMMTGLTPGIPVTIEVVGEHHSYRLFELIPVPVEVNTGAKQRSEYLKNDINKYAVRRAPFMTYEVYRPMFNIFQPAGVSAAAAFICQVEYCRKQRTRKWEILVTHGDVTRKLEFIVDEYPVRIPSVQDQKQRYINWINYNNIADCHGLSKWTPAYDEMLRKYYDVLLYSRQNMVNLPITECFDLVDGQPVLNEEKLDHVVDIALKAGFTWFNGNAFIGRYSSQADDKAFFDSLPHDTIENPDEICDAYRDKAFDAFDNGTLAWLGFTKEIVPSESGNKHLFDMHAQVYAYIEKKGLKDRWMQCCMDEPNAALTETYAIASQIVHEAMPGIKTMEPVLPDFRGEGTVDIWCPSLDIYEKNQEFYNAQVEKGDELIVYSCLTPGGNYCNRLLDQEHLRQVWIGWAPVLYPNVTGFLHWGANQAGHDAYHRSARQFAHKAMDFHEKLAMMLPAGDPLIIYPWGDMPCVSSRSEAHRIGYEDLGLLEQLPVDKAAELTHKVFNGYADYTKDISLYREVKEELMQAVMEQQ